jgi:protein ImuB
MDWPAVAAAVAAGLPATAPVAVTLANRVVACSAAARSAGVRRGLRRREAQARCPHLHVVTADPGRDARHFEVVTAAVDEVVPRAELLRPGLMVLSVRGAARYFGSEEVAAERLVDAVAAAGVECQVGIADQLPTAVFAARAGRIVEPEADASFLAALSIRQLAGEPSLAAPGREDLADLLWRMGIRTIGQFAALSSTDVASRFGADAIVAHRFARGEPARGPAGREPPRELDAVMSCDPPVDRVDAAAFAGRSLAVELHRSLESAGVGCTRLAIHAVTANGEELQRVWRCAEPLTEDATADRVRWQLDGWLNRRGAGQRPGNHGGPTAPITTLSLHPVEVVSAAALQLPLWGSSGDDDRLRARRALVRVQGLLGPEAVQVPVLSGGRGPAERITFTPFGDEPVPRADPSQPWPGQLPEPAPAVLLDDPVDLLDAEGAPVRVTNRGLFSTTPARLAAVTPADARVAALLPASGGTLIWWAGPWPVDERWWSPADSEDGSEVARGFGSVKYGRTARAQVLLDGADRGGGRAMLLCYRQRRWYVEGVYE